MFKCYWLYWFDSINVHPVSFFFLVRENEEMIEILSTESSYELLDKMIQILIIDHFVLTVSSLTTHF
jgi:hypothetical protein